jgi:hypothetical protein
MQDEKKKEGFKMMWNDDGEFLKLKKARFEKCKTHL